jgi:hypothetical protein
MTSCVPDFCSCNCEERTSTGNCAVGKLKKKGESSSLKYIVIEMGSDVIFQREILVEISWGPYLVTRVRVTPNLILEVAEMGTAYV